MDALNLLPEDRDAISRLLVSLSDRAKRSLSLDQLLTTWCSFVERIERGYGNSIYEYTNELSSRDVLEEILVSAPATARTELLGHLRPWDDRFERSTRPVSVAVAPGVPKNAASWWYRVPRLLAGELEADLHSQGIY